MSSLVQKLIQIYEKIEYVEKRGFNKSQNYKYTKAADMLNGVRKELARLGVYAEINMDFSGPTFTIAREKSPTAPFSAERVKCSAIFHDSEGGETITASGIGTGADTGDKAAYKAGTGAIKQMLRNAFLIPDEGADPEADESVDEEPDFQNAHHSTPSYTKPESQKAAATAKASTSPAPVQPTVTKSELPAVVAALVQQTFDTSDKTMPTEQEMKEYRDRYRKLGDDLSEPAKGGLKTSRSNPINRKIAAYMCEYVGAKNPTDVTKEQWTKFLKHVDDTVAQENGYKALATLIDPEAFKKQ